MPRGSDGNFSLPAGTLVSTGDTILVSQHNPAMQDIAAGLGNSLDRDGSGGMRAPLNMGSNKITGLAPGVNATDAATVSQITGNAFPPGIVLDFAGSTVPGGWLLCGGQSLGRADYPALFAAIGTTYGAVNGSSFSLPDLRGRVAAGRDFSSGGLSGRLTSATMSPDGATLGAAGGAQTHVLTEAQMPSHTHAVTGSTNVTGAHTHQVSVSDTVFPASSAGETSRPEAGPSLTSSAGDHSHTIAVTAAATGGGVAHTNVQPTVLLNKIIKV